MYRVSTVSFEQNVKYTAKQMTAILGSKILPWGPGLSTPLFFLGHTVTNTCVRDMGIFVPKRIY